jgi:hypothetical protein
MKKGQSAMEYLMTYGWAILIVIIVAAALYALGVFNPATYAGSRATGFANIGTPATGNWKLSATAAEDQFTVKLKNNLASRLMFTAAAVKIGATDCTGEDFNDAANMTVGIGGEFTVEGNCGAFQSGNTYTATVELTYDNLDSGLTGFKETGTVTGTVS